MSDRDQIELRLRDELRAIPEPIVDVERLVAAGHRRSRRRTVRRRVGAATAAAGLAAVATIVLIPRERVDTVTDASAFPPTPTVAPLPTDVPLGEGTTWPGGPFDPIDGMASVPGATPLSDDQSMEIYETESRLIGACMADQGYEWGSAVAADRVGAMPLYLSPDELRADGYRYDWAAAAQEFLGASGGQAASTEGMTDEEVDAYNAALGGSGESVRIDTIDGSVATRSGGCTGEARQLLYGSLGNHLRYDELHQEFSDLSRELRAHDEYAEPLTDWQACMADAGFDVGDADYGASWIRQAGAVALSEDGEGQEQFNQETIPQISNADADCQESSGLYEVRESLLDAAYREIASDLGVDLDHYVAYEHALYTRARQIP